MRPRLNTADARATLSEPVPRCRVAELCRASRPAQLLMMSMRIRRAALIALLAGLVPITPSVSPVEAQSINCTIPGKNQYVRDVLFDYYYWYRQLPSTNPATFGSPEEYLEAVRYRDLDRTFSYIANRLEEEALLSSSQFVGLGISTRFDGEEMRISQVFPGSPASEAGLARGDRITSINGRSVADLSQSGQIGSAFGPSEDGLVIELSWRGREGNERSGRLVKRAVTIPTVDLTRLYDVDGRRVGYIFFRNFVEPSIGALDAAFMQLREAGATELVLDLRYNGGGLVDVAQHLASLIGGQRTEGRVFAAYTHNDRHPELNRTMRFERKSNAMELERLVVITTRASASASELVINALRPFMPVVIVGDTTYGKPVGQLGFPFCDKVLRPVSFILRNANNQADFFNGFEPDCRAADDLDHEFGSVSEPSLAESLAYLRTGSCTSPAADGGRQAAGPQARRPARRWVAAHPRRALKTPRHSGDPERLPLASV